MKKYRVGIIGRTGRGDYGHGLDEVWRELPQAEIVSIADENPAGLKSRAERLGIKARYADYRKMLAAESPDIVSVAPRWLDCHHDMVLACAEHGASIFLEKPMCRTLAEADAMVRACEERHVKLAIAHQTRYSPRVKTISELIRKGKIGRLLELRGRGKEDRRGGGEDLWVLGTHIFDLMRIFGGEARSCFARVTQKGRPVGPEDVREGNEGIGPLAGDGIEACYEMENGCTAFFSSHRDMAARPSRFGLSLFGSRGVVKLHTGYLPDVHILEDPSWGPGRTGSRWKPVSSAGIDKPEPRGKNDLLARGNGNVAIVTDLIESIEKDRQPLGNIYHARAATEMIAAVFESHRLRAPVSLPLKNRDNPLRSLKKRS
jgi:predicted dehydrogenase